MDMLRHIRRTLSIVLVVFLIAAGSSCSKAVGGRSSSTTLRTVLTIFDPFDEGGIKSGVVVTGRTHGDCQGSNLVSRNPGARRCFTDDSEVLDPCFVSSAPGAELALCVSDPTAVDAVELTIGSDEGSTGETNAFAGEPWFVELMSGQKCRLLGGATTELNGLRMNFACDDEAYLYGSPDRSRPVWRIHFQEPGSAELTVVSLRRAWY